MSDIKNTILSMIDTLPSAERRLADVVLSHGDQLAVYSANELAKKANVSAATAVRFFKRLGFESFQQFKVHARAQMNEAAPLNRLSHHVHDASHADRTAFVSNESRNIAETFQALTTHEIERFTAAVVASSHIWVVGFRNGQILASYFQALLQQLRPDVRLFVGNVAHIPEQLSDITKDDLVIVMDFRRRSIMLKAVLDHARSEAAQIALVTDLLEEPLSKAGDIVFKASTQGESLFDSHAATMSLLNFLASTAAASLGENTARKLQKIERIHKNMKDIISR